MDMSALVTEARRLHQLILTDTVEVDWNDYVVTDVYGTALKTLAERESDVALWQELTEYFSTHD